MITGSSSKLNLIESAQIITLSTMATRRLWALALALQSVAAFKDTSPFFLFSTSQYAHLVHLLVPIANQVTE
jgi:hypothetical protein